MRIAGLVVAALITIASGLWLTRAGRPYGAGLVAVHKLADLAALVLVGWMVVVAHRAAMMHTLEWTVVVAAATLAVVALLTGGALSATESTPAWVRWAHRVTAWGAAATVAPSAVVVARVYSGGA